MSKVEIYNSKYECTFGEADEGEYFMIESNRKYLYLKVDNKSKAWCFNDGVFMNVDDSVKIVLLSNNNVTMEVLL